MSVSLRIKNLTGIFSGNLGGKSEINSSKQISSWAWCKSASEAWFLCTKIIRKPCRCLRSLSSKAKFTSAGEKKKRKKWTRKHMKKLKKNQIKQTKPQISLDKFYLLLKISNEKALTATRLLNRHNLHW